MKYFHVSFHRNYSFLNSEIVANSNSCRNISIFYLINLLFDAEAIQGGNYSRVEQKQKSNLYLLLVLSLSMFLFLITFIFFYRYFQSSCYYLFHIFYDAAIWSIFYLFKQLYIPVFLIILCWKLLSVENPFEFIWNPKSSFEIWKFNLNLKFFYPVWKFISNMDPEE